MASVHAGTSSFSSIRPMLLSVCVAAAVLGAAEAKSGFVVAKQELSDGWALVNGNGSVNVPSNVTEIPGHVHTDLLRAGLIKDPYFRFEDDNLTWVRNDTWTYTCGFHMPAEMITRIGNVVLEFDGIDTAANITLNGAHLASVANQHRKYRLDVTSVLNNENNQLVVVLSPATAFAAAAAAEYPYNIGDETFIPQHLASRAFIRKQQSDFGWDWGPALAPAGIWRPVRLVQFKDVLLTNVVPSVTLNGDIWKVTVRVFYIGEPTAGACFATAAVGGSKTQAALTDGTADVSGANDAMVTLSLAIRTADVEQWWPAGYGAQPLYNLTVTVVSGSDVLDSASQSIGFRDATLVEEPIDDPEGQGLSFYFRVNHVSIFAKGSNWIPADAFDNRATDERLRRLLTSAVLAGQNMIRVWGGGNYMRDSFWSLCDELGLMVWLDFMHGGGRSPRHSAHISEWAAEVRDNVRRIAGHPSLVMYNGNNEGIKSVSSNIHGTPVPSYNQPDTQAIAFADYTALFDDTVRRVVAAEDVTRHFHASCPSNGYLYDDTAEQISIQRMGDPFDNHFGDTRHYDYNSYCLDSSLFPRGRFLSEYGWQSYPSISTLLPVTEEEDLNINSSWAEHVQHHPNGNPQLLAQNAIFFDSPSSFAAFVEQTQAVQALCIATQSRFYRAQRNTSGARTMGCMYWQLEDIWPAPSWASIESGETARWKALHYHIKRAYDPVMLFADLSGTNVTADKRVIVSNASVSIQAVSDKLAAIAALNVTWALWDWNGVVASRQSTIVSVPALSVTTVLKPTLLSALLKTQSPENSVLVVTASGSTSSGEKVSTSTELFLTPFKDMQFPPTVPTVNVTCVGSGASSVEVSVVADSMVPLLTLAYSGSLAGYFSDNSFLAFPGQPQTITFTTWGGSPVVSTFMEELSVRSSARVIRLHKFSPYAV